jgi:hypothetical protein
MVKSGPQKEWCFYSTFKHPYIKTGMSLAYIETSNSVQSKKI